MPSLTYVTAFLDLKEEQKRGDVEKENKPYDEAFFSWFNTLAETGIPICLFVSPNHYAYATKQIRENVYVMPPVDLYELSTYKVTSSVAAVGLPVNKAANKDTYNFMVLMNAKIEFLNKAIQMDPFRTSHFAWIDFRITRIIKSPSTLDRLVTYTKARLKDRMLVVPVCWKKEWVVVDTLYDRIIWRFCGGFFMGDRESIMDFYEVYQKYYKMFLEERRVLVWEVNFWAWLEKKGYWSPSVYEADHNDSMLLLPDEYVKN